MKFRNSLIGIFLILLASIIACRSSGVPTSTPVGNQSGDQSGDQNFPTEIDSNGIPFPFEFQIKSMECRKEVVNEMRKCEFIGWLKARYTMTLDEMYSFLESYSQASFVVHSVEGNDYEIAAPIPGSMNIPFLFPAGLPLSETDSSKFLFRFEIGYQETPETLNLSMTGYQTKSINIPEITPGEEYINQQYLPIDVDVEKYSDYLQPDANNFVKLTDAIDIAATSPIRMEGLRNLFSVNSRQKYPSYFTKLMTCHHNNAFRFAIPH